MRNLRKNFKNRRQGIVLILTIITLVVLATMLYTLGAKLSGKFHRDQYIIDYQKARYGCDSAAKYALAVIDEYDFDLVKRPNEPDFSDLFQMSQEEYDRILEEYRIQYAADMNLSYPDENGYNSRETETSENSRSDANFADLIKTAQENLFMESDFADVNSEDSEDEGFAFGDGFGFGSNPLEELYIRGPYGYKWPMVTKPLEFVIGDVNVVVEIEDENAKFPLTWGLTRDPNYQKQSDAAVESFFEWMGLSLREIEIIKTELDAIEEVKPFSLKMPEIVTVTKIEQKVEAQQSSRRRSLRSRRSRTKTITSSTKRDPTLHLSDFSKILNSSLLSNAQLQKAVVESEDRVENAYKYLGFGGTRKVNINSAPRHVLEAAFTFGGDEVALADAIIKMRKIKPFENIEELADELYQYNDSIEKSKPFLTTKSEMFTIHITAYSGSAKASVIAAVRKENEKGKEKVKTIAVFSR